MPVKWPGGPPSAWAYVQAPGALDFRARSYDAWVARAYARAPCSTTACRIARDDVSVDAPVGMPENPHVEMNAIFSAKLFLVW